MNRVFKSSRVIAFALTAFLMLPVSSAVFGQELSIEIARENTTQERLISARAFADGNGVPRDGVKAMNLLLPLLAQGNSEAAALAGRMWENGWNASDQEIERVNGLELTSEEYLGSFQSILERKSHTKAVGYYKTSLSSRFNAELAYRLGHIFFLGRDSSGGNDTGFPAAPESAISYFEQASEAGHAEAKFYLAFAAERGLGREKNLRKASELFAELSENGHVRAALSLERINNRQALNDLLLSDVFNNSDSVDFIPTAGQELEISRGLGQESIKYAVTDSQEVVILNEQNERVFASYLLTGTSVRVRSDGTESLFIEYKPFSNSTRGELVFPDRSKREIGQPEKPVSGFLRQVRLTDQTFETEASEVPESKWILEVQAKNTSCTAVYSPDFLRAEFTRECETFRFLDFFTENEPLSDYKRQFLIPDGANIIRIGSGTEFSIFLDDATFSWTVPDGMTVAIELDESSRSPEYWELENSYDRAAPNDLRFLFSKGGSPLISDNGKVIGWITTRYRPKTLDGGHTDSLYSIIRALKQLSGEYRALERLTAAKLFNELIKRGPNNELSISRFLELSDAHYNLENYGASIEFSEKALTAATALFGVNSQPSISALELISAAYLRQGEIDIAMAVLRRAISVNINILKSSHEARDGATNAIDVVSGLRSSLLLSYGELLYSNGDYKDSATVLLELSAREVLGHRHDGNFNAFRRQFAKLSDALYYSGNTEGAEIVAKYMANFAKTEAGVNEFDEPLPKPYPVPEMPENSSGIDVRKTIAPGAEDLARFYFHLNYFSDADTAMSFAAEVANEQSGVGSTNLVERTRAATFFSMISGTKTEELIPKFARAFEWKLGPDDEKPLPPNLPTSLLRQSLDLWLTLIENLYEEEKISIETLLLEYSKIFYSFDKTDALNELSIASRSISTATADNNTLELLSAWRSKVAELQTIDSRLSNGVRSRVSASELENEANLRDQRRVVWIEMKRLEDELSLKVFGEKEIATKTQIETIQSMLDEDERVVAVLPLHFGVYFLVIEPEFVAYASQPIHRYKLDPLLAAYRNEVAWPSSEKNLGPRGNRLNTDALLEFRRVFWDPIAKFVDGKKLTIVPYGELRTVPFEAIPLGNLDSGGISENEIQTMRFLGLEQQIAYAPSMQIVEDQMRRRNSTDDEYLVNFVGMGDPIIGTPNLRQKLSSFGDYLFRSSGPNADLLPLPETASEIRDLQEIFDGANEDIFLRENATRKTLLSSEALSEAKVIAFATHAIPAMNSETDGFPEPFLLLSPSDSTDGAGSPAVQLALSDVLKLNIRAKLVLLSACQTASSDGSFGSDGLTGLVRGFFVAGAQNILASLWDVESRSSYYLTTSFAKIASSKSKTLGEALLAARLDVFGDGRYSHPKFWSAFVLVGDLKERL